MCGLKNDRRDRTWAQACGCSAHEAVEIWNLRNRNSKGAQPSLTTPSTKLLNAPAPVLAGPGD